MKNVPIPTGLLAPLLFCLTNCGLLNAGFAQAPSPADQSSTQTAGSDLNGTSWQLVRFQGGDGKVLTPADPASYTVAFSDGTLSTRIDCNRGHGAWSSAGPNQIQFGPMAMTRAMCPPAPLNDRLAADWQFVRSYTMKEGHLFLSLMADGGTYEFAPAVAGQEAGANTSPASPGSPSSLSDLPATFTGTMPCADCPGIDYVLAINPDHAYTSKMTYQERNVSLDDSGHWDLDGTTLTLHGSRGSTDKFAVRDANTLHKLDINGQDIQSPFNYDLKRQTASASSGATVAGNAGASPASSLEGTHWALTRLGDNPVTSDSGPRAPYLEFDASTHRVSGSSGCNRVMGSYTLNRDQLSFGQMAGTMMACAQGMDTERAFLDALQQVSKWKMAGRTLELYDASGKPLATLEASAAQ